MNSSNKSKKLKGIRAWAVMIDDTYFAVKLFKPSAYEWRKDALNVPEAKVVEVLITPIPKRKRVKR